MRASDDNLTDSEREILDAIETQGVHVEHVAGGDGGPGFSFTVGLWHTFGQPEVIVFGLEDHVAQDLLDEVADLADEGRKFLADSKHDGLLQHYPARFFAVPKSAYAEFLGVAVWAYEGDDFAAVQLVWPDKQGRWPWEAGVRDVFRERQPVLARREPPA